MSALRIVFMGTPELAAASLAALLHTPDLQVAAVATQPDRPKGRDLKLHPSPVKQTALAAGLPVFQPEKAREETFIEQLRQLQPDLIAVAAYGQILPRSILDLPRLGCINVHTSLLPKYRGAAPIQWAILNGDTESGVTIMKIDLALDSGDILSQRSVPIGPADTGQVLHDRLAAVGAQLLVETIPDYAAGRITPHPQPAEGVSYARKIRKEDGRIDWQQPARTIVNRLRAFTPWPGVFAFRAAQPRPQLLKIWEAEVVTTTGKPGEILSADTTGLVVGCGMDALRITILQCENSRRMTTREFLAGHPIKPGEMLA